MSSPRSLPALPRRREVHVLSSCYGPVRPLLHDRGGLSCGSGGRRPRSGLPGISNVRFDQHVARNAGGGDPVAAVPDVERLAGTRQAHRRRLATLLEPHAVALDLRAVETTVSEADVRERDPGRCERRICDTPPFSRSSRVRTGGVEPPQPLATRLQRAELAGARRPQGEARRPVGFEPTLRGSRPRMLAVTSRPPREMEGGIGSPQPGAETLPSGLTPEPAVVPFGSPACVVATPPPPHRLALEACRPSCTLGPALCTALFRHFPTHPSASRSFVDSAGGIRTHGLELMRLARTAAPLPRAALSRESEDLVGRIRTCDLRRPKSVGWPSPLRPVTSELPGRARACARGVEALCSSG